MATLKERVTNKGFNAFVEQCVENYQSTHGTSETRIVWDSMIDIIEIINQLAKSAGALNMFMPKFGFMNVRSAKLAQEYGFMEVLGSGNPRYICPKALVLEYNPISIEWSYFRLESVPQTKFEEHHCIDSFNHMIQLPSTEYVDINLLESDAFRIEHPEYKVVMRYFEGDFVIWPAKSPYNVLASSATDGRHSDLNRDEFRFYIDCCIGEPDLLEWTLDGYAGMIDKMKAAYAESLV